MSRILAIETSCDETAIALIEAEGGLRAPKFKVLREAVASQIKTHRPWGGVVPTLAKREHLKNLPLLFRNYAYKNDRFYTRVDLTAVTVGPGLEPCLWTGINFAKEIQKKYFPHAKPMGVNHLEGHLYSFLLSQKTQFPISSPSQVFSENLGGQGFQFSKLFPAISLIVSGGHTILLLMKSLTKWKKLGETRDDAAGEAFDKAAKMLGLPYPGGPEIEKLAKKGDPAAINFPRPMIHQKNYDFSFSGLKTAALYYLRASVNFTNISPRSYKNVSKLNFAADVAASFQQAAIDVLITKTLRAAEEFGAKSIMLSGGVAANKALQKEFQKRIQKSQVTSYQLLVTKFPTDNAVMIAMAAYVNLLRKKNHRLTAQPNLNL